MKKRIKFADFFDKALESLFDSIGENAEDIIKKIGDINFIRSTMKRYFTFFAFISASLVILSHGFGLMLNDYFPEIKLWMFYLGIGALLLIFGLVYKKIK